MTTKTIAQQLNITNFPFEIKCEKGNEVYFENSNSYWIKSQFDEKGNRIYCENSNGYIVDNRPKQNNMENNISFESYKKRNAEYDNASHIVVLLFLTTVFIIAVIIALI